MYLTLFCPYRTPQRVGGDKKYKNPKKTKNSKNENHPYV
jgi:hypothetical protein